MKASSSVSRAGAPFAIYDTSASTTHRQGRSLPRRQHERWPVATNLLPIPPHSRPSGSLRLSPHESHGRVFGVPRVIPPLALPPRVCLESLGSRGPFYTMPRAAARAPRTKFTAAIQILGSLANKTPRFFGTKCRLLQDGPHELSRRSRQSGIYPQEPAAVSSGPYSLMAIGYTQPLKHTGHLCSFQQTVVHEHPTASMDDHPYSDL